tara:strand:+ start:5768 stop:6292 length:525 start_codon:yes stop_codon:yes gene_type:complete
MEKVYYYFRNSYFFSRRNNKHSIQKVSSLKHNILIESLRKKLAIVNHQITDTTKELLKVQAVGIRATFSRNNNWLDRLQKKFYWSQIQESSLFYREKLIILHKERKYVQSELDRLTGRYWIKRILRWIILLTIFIISLSIAWILFLSLLASLYLLPIWGAIIIIYIFFQKRVKL